MNISPTREALSVMASLRPPSSRPLKLLYGFRSEVYTNNGYTFEIESGESAISPGTGTVSSAVKRFAKFKNTQNILAGTPTYEVTIVHSGGVQTVVAGLASLAVRPGDAISRGDILGQPATSQIFFGVRYLNEMFSPHELGRHWRTQNEYVPGQAGNLRQATDKLIRNFAGTIASSIYQGIRYFVDLIRGFKPLMVNVDFNGNGSKVGFAGLGLTDADYWNVYAAGAFNWQNNVSGCYSYATYVSADDYRYVYVYPYLYTYSYPYSYFYAYGLCGQTKVFNQNPQMWLNDSTDIKSPVWIERAGPATSASGTYATWDAMASTWIGGWSGGIPEENSFALRGLPAGTYKVACYASSFGRYFTTGTTFFVSVNNGAPAIKATIAIATPAFIEDSNYVVFTVAVPAGGTIVVKAYGYFDGLQLERLS